jgi:hypothetical protein
MKSTVFLLAVILLPATVLGQMKKYEYSPKVKGKIEIKNLLGEISLQNSAGSSIIIESDFDMETPERAEGLKLLGSAEDNSGLGVNVTEENGVVLISGAVKQVRDYKYKISVPAGVAVNLDYNSPFTAGDLVIESFKGSLETKTLAASVKITNTTGPLTVNTISGNVEVVFSNINQEAPTSLASISGLIDVTVPSGEKATVNVSNMSGNVYNNLDLKPVKEAASDERAYGMSPIRQDIGDFTLNGGGQKLLLKSISGNIYLRKK